MTDIEYKEFAQKVVNDYFQDDTGEDCVQDICITHIGELFLLKIKEAVTLLDESTHPYNRADKLKNMVYFALKNKVKNSCNDIDGLYNINNSHSTNILSNFCLFWGIYSAVKYHSNPEYMLQNLGIETPIEFISYIKELANIEDINEFLDSISELIQNLVSILDYNKLTAFFLWGFVVSIETNLIKFCKEELAKDVLDFFKSIKEFGEKYPSICNERIALFYYKFKSIFEDSNTEFVPNDFLIIFLENNYYKLADSNIDYSKWKDFVVKYSSIFLDVIFLL